MFSVLGVHFYILSAVFQTDVSGIKTIFFYFLVYLAFSPLIKFSYFIVILRVVMAKRAKLLCKVSRTNLFTISC